MTEQSFIQKGDDFMKRGDRKFQGSCIESLCGTKAERVEKAEEDFKQAITNYKLGKQWEKAGEANLKLYNCHKFIKSNEAVDYLIEASSMKKKINKNSEAIELMQEAAELFIADNRISSAAKTKKDIAQMFENEMEYTLASRTYQEAAAYFELESNYVHDYNNCRLKVADLCIEIVPASYDTGIKVNRKKIFLYEIYEEVADKYLEKQITATSAKHCFFKACFLYLANEDSVGCRMAIERFSDKSAEFSADRRCIFMTSLVDAMDQKDSAKFLSECQNYQKITPFDKWQKKVMEKINEKLPQEKPVQVDEIQNDFL